MRSSTPYARREHIWLAQEIVKAYRPSVAEAIAAGEITQQELDRVPRFAVGMTTKAACNRVIDATKRHMQEWPFQRIISAQMILAEASYRYCKQNRLTQCSRAHNDNVLRYVEQSVAKIQIGDVDKLKFYNGAAQPQNLKNREDAEAAFKATLSNIRDTVNAKLAETRNQPAPTAPVMPEPEPVDVDEDEIFEDVVQDVPTTSTPVEPEPAPIIEIVPEREILREARELNLDINNAAAMTEDARDPITGHSFDNVGFRWYLPSAELLVAGVNRQIILSNLTRTWPLEQKRSLWNRQGVKFNAQGEYIADSDISRMNNPWDYDPTQFRANDSIPGARFITDEDHKAMGLALTFLHRTKLCWLIGPPGTGKTHMVGGCAQKLGKELDTEFRYVVLSLTRATSPSAFYGKQRIDGTAFLIEFLHAMAEGNTKLATELSDKAKGSGDVTISLFERILRKGGIIGLDEADRADPNTMQMLNAVIAQRHFVNTVSQQEFDLDPDAMFMMMTNTEGTGASRAHNTADKMDDATVDRFRVSRMFVGLDKELANREYWKIINTFVG